MINLGKSFFYLRDNTPLIVAITLRRITGIKQGSFMFTYLGCPVFYVRMRIFYFHEMMKKIQKIIFAWQKTWLSFGGKYILIQNVLMSMPIYLLLAMNPPKKVIERIHQVFARFF